MVAVYAEIAQNIRQPFVYMNKTEKQTCHALNLRRMRVIYCLMWREQGRRTEYGEE